MLHCMMAGDDNMCEAEVYEENIIYTGLPSSATHAQEKIEKTKKKKELEK